MKTIVFLVASALQLAASPLIVAHRGASHDAPENTIPAFELAWEKGADAIEGDFHLTADGKIVCIHDYDTKRTTGVRKVIKETTLEEITKLEAGSWFGPQWKGTSIPTFLDVAATVPAKGKFYIEVKCGPEIIPTLIAELNQSKLKDEQVVIISFNSKVIQDIKQHAPKYKACWLSSFEKGSPLSPSSEVVLKTLKSINADGFSSKADSRITSGYIQSLLDAGFDYHCWTIDDAAQANRFQQLGAMSITTNRPQFIRTRLNE